MTQEPQRRIVWSNGFTMAINDIADSAERQPFSLETLRFETLRQQTLTTGIIGC
jgi:hypothetical protein